MTPPEQMRSDARDSLDMVCMWGADDNCHMQHPMHTDTPFLFGIASHGVQRSGSLDMGCMATMPMHPEIPFLYSVVAHGVQHSDTLDMGCMATHAS